jgi:hypothetical protein
MLHGLWHYTEPFLSTGQEGVTLSHLLNWNSVLKSL